MSGVEEEIQMVETPPYSQPPPFMPHAYGSLDSNNGSMSMSDGSEIQPPPLPILQVVGNGIRYNDNSNEQGLTPNSNDSGVSRGNSTMTDMDKGAVGGVSEEIPLERQESLEKLMRSLQGLEDEIDNEVSANAKRRTSGLAIIPDMTDAGLPPSATDIIDTDQRLLERQDSSYDALNEIANGSFPGSPEVYTPMSPSEQFAIPPVLQPVGKPYNSNPTSPNQGYAYNPANTSTFQPQPLLPPGVNVQNHQENLQSLGGLAPEVPIYENTKASHMMYQGPGQQSNRNT